MKIFTLRTTQFIPASLDECWSFFSSPENLEKITPPSMAFKILSEKEPKMYAGQIIIYSVKPFPFIKMTWVTEISQVKKGEFFIDEQRFGPYKFWHHKHFFKSVPGGVEMNDVIHYALPFGIFGRMALPIVKNQLSNIFQFRKNKIEKVFPLK